MVFTRVVVSAVILGFLWVKRSKKYENVRSDKS